MRVTLAAPTRPARLRLRDPVYMTELPKGRRAMLAMARGALPCLPTLPKPGGRLFSARFVAVRGVLWQGWAERKMRFPSGLVQDFGMRFATCLVLYSCHLYTMNIRFGNQEK